MIESLLMMMTTYNGKCTNDDNDLLMVIKTYGGKYVFVRLFVFCFVIV